jgi:hypothetical protein
MGAFPELLVARDVRAAAASDASVRSGAARVQRPPPLARKHARSPDLVGVVEVGGGGS